ncbi:MAG TPA: hypothetical protein VHE32_03845 [Rhodanobacteraceae bacterium]|nr:hypothetical protein [Rhodanobacteraceae bacterium]
MTTASHDELLSKLNELLQGQIKQIELTELALDMARADTVRRDALMTKYDESVASAKNRFRIQVRVYGLMMAVFGAVFALLLLNAIRSG